MSIKVEHLMKNLLPIAIIPLVMLSCRTASSIPATPEQRTMQKIMTFEGYTKKQIYDKSLQWIAASFISGKSVLEYQDPALGKIMGNVMMNYYRSPGFYIRGKLEIDIKDAKSRVSIRAESVTSPPGPYNPGGDFDVYGSDVRAVRISMHDMIATYSDYIKKSEAKDTW